MASAESDFDKAVGAALRQARLSRACTQADLAHILGVDRSAIAHYEAGKRPLTVSMLLRAAQALGYPVQRLLPGGATNGDAPQDSLPASVAQIARLLVDRPELVPTVIDLLETILPDEALD